jgi:hypothetical protein
MSMHRACHSARQSLPKTGVLGLRNGVIYEGRMRTGTLRRRLRCSGGTSLIGRQSAALEVVALSG